jgi:hypothetical protein
MATSRKTTDWILFAVVAIALVALFGAGAYFSSTATQVMGASSLASSAELRARDMFRANYQALNGSLVSAEEMQARSAFRTNYQALLAGNAAARIPVTGVQPAQQRALNAYSARLTGLANSQLYMSERAAFAYSQRYSAQAGMSRRALAAYSARWQAIASSYQGK